jgi:Mg2+-importing ATPase
MNLTRLKQFFLIFFCTRYIARHYRRLALLETLALVGAKRKVRAIPAKSVVVDTEK